MIEGPIRGVAHRLLVPAVVILQVTHGFNEERPLSTDFCAPALRRRRARAAVIHAALWRRYGDSDPAVCGTECPTDVTVDWRSPCSTLHQVRAARFAICYKLGHSWRMNAVEVGSGRTQTTTGRVVLGHRCRAVGMRRTWAISCVDGAGVSRKGLVERRTGSVRRVPRLRRCRRGAAVEPLGRTRLAGRRCLERPGNTDGG
jgi:hypothetical protein